MCWYSVNSIHLYSVLSEILRDEFLLKNLDPKTSVDNFTSSFLSVASFGYSTNLQEEHANLMKELTDAKLFTLYFGDYTPFGMVFAVW